MKLTIVPRVRPLVTLGQSEQRQLIVGLQVIDMRPEHACRRVAEVHIVDIVTYRCDKGVLFGETGHKK